MSGGGRYKPQSRTKWLISTSSGMSHFYLGEDMEDMRPKAIIEAMTLTKEIIDLEKDLDVLDYNYKNARSSILNRQAKIRLRLGELIRIEGIVTQRSKGA